MTQNAIFLCLIYSRMLTRLVVTAIFCGGLFFLLLTKSVYAEWEDPIFVSLENTNTYVVLTGDFNGDGALDYVSGQDIVFFGETEPPSVLYLNKNDGTGQFVKGSTFTGLAEAVGDMNGDGTLDIITNDAGVIKIYLNDGHGNIVNTITLTNSHDTGLIAVGDMNRDGDLDIVTGNFRIPSRVYFNNGNDGTFTAGSDLLDSTLTLSVALGDVNGDEAIDIVTGKAFTQSVPVTADVLYPHTVVYLNDQAGGFTKASTLSKVIPKDNLPTNVSPYVAFSANVKVGHVDTDRVLDIIVGISYWGVEVYTDLANLTVPDTRGTNSIALGDVNNDSFLDMVTFNTNVRKTIVYLNDTTGNLIKHTTLTNAFPDFFASGFDNIALGDLDNNSSLDIILGLTKQPDIVYLNNGVGGFSKVFTFNHIPCKPGNPITCSVYKPSTIAVGDVDNNGTLDLIQSTILGSDIWGQVAIILNGGGSNCNGVQYLETPVTPRTPDPDDITQVVLGDINNDNALDIIQASYDNDTSEGYLVIYPNSKDGCGTFAKGMFIDNNNQNLAVTSIVVGDLNDDGTLDVIGGSKGKPSAIYLNQKNNPGNFTRGTEIAGLDKVRSMVIGDVNGDGSSDLVAGNFEAPIAVYLNQNDGSGSFNRRLELAGVSTIRSVALGDVNNDGALDLVAGSDKLPIIVYLNNGTGAFNDFITLADSGASESLAVNDINGDGTIDIIGNDFSNTFLLFLNDGEAKFRGGVVLPSSQRLEFGRSLAIGDLNNDGTLDVALARAGEPNTLIYLNVYQRTNLFTSNSALVQSAALENFSALANNSALASNSAYVAVKRPLTTGDANFFSSPRLVDSLTIPITYTLFDNESNSVGRIGVQYSLDGGGGWYTATPTTTHPISNLSTSPYPLGEKHIFSWDTFASGFFGQSDNVVLRFRAYPQDSTTASPGAYRYTDTVAGPYQWPYASATTFPFSARGTQILVYTGTVSSGNEVAGALVYRLQKGQTRGATLMGDEFGPFTTSRNGDRIGYLSGRGQLGQGDQLIALSPITSTEAYTVYYTNITPTVNGLAAFTVTVPGVQKLVVAPSRPLILFNLKVSLEWDARKDTTYLEQLRFDLLRTSELLFDLTNGQAALGNVTIHFNKEQWDTADIRIHATNDLRPHASVGGVVRKPRLERFNTGKGAHLYAPGHVEIGAVWNRYGNAGEKLSEDWARTLTHELGHYLFFLHDNYIGLENGRLIRVEGCPGMMGDPYTDSDSEFHPDLNWLGSPCEKTFSHQVLGQSDWATIRHFYPWLNTPTVAINDPKNSGPSLLPLAVTNILSAPLSSEAQTVDVPSFTIGKEDGSRYVASNNARAFLLQGNRLVNLGAPRLDRVQAWNARPDDQLCVYDLVAQSSPLTRCQRITTSGQEITLRPQPGWQPEVNVTLINSRTVEISVIVGNTQINRPLSARIYPQTPLADALPAIPLTPNPSTGAFVGSVTLTQPALEAYVHIFDNEMDPQYAALTEYTLGGAPTLQLSNGNTLQLSNGDTLVLSNGGTLVLSNGETRTLNPGDTLQLSNGGTLVFTEQGLTLVLSNGSTVIINNETLQLSNGGTLQLSNGDTLQLSNGGTLVLSNGNTLVVEEGETLMLSNGDAPIRSSDGQVVLFGEPTNTGPGEFYTLQVTTKLPMTLTYATLVGQPYRLTASPGARKLSGASISFNYLGRDIDRDKEYLLKIYFWDGAQWERLPTTVDDYHNIAAAVVPDTKSGLGIYALMYSTEIPLTGPNWNIFAFVGPNKQLVADALASLNKNVYSIVWGYEPHPDPSDPRHWQAYDPTIPPTHKFYDWVNNLKSLTYGRGYWINISATQDITLYLKSRAGTVTTNASTLETVGTTTSPPAVYYGEVWPTEDFTPLPGMTVTAWVDGQLCGQTQTRELQGTVAYVLYIPAIGDSEYPNCGAVGRTVTFKVNDVPMLLNIGWDNTTIRLAPLFNRWVNPFFLPIIVK